MQIGRRRLLEGAALITVAGCTPAPAPSTKTAQKKPDALGDSDAVGVAARIKSGEITAAEAAEAAIARAEAINPKIHAIVTPAFDKARERAKQTLTGPLAGVPTLIKDLNPVTGIAWMEGSRAYKGRIAAMQSPYIDALFAAGLNPIGKSATPEFGLTATTEPMLGAATANPWDLTRSSGGSSGGAAAAVAAGIVPVAHASDGGGSIRIPSSCCGLFGLKVSSGRSIESPGQSPVDIAVMHCVARSVRDSAAWLAVTERTDPKAPFKPAGLVTGPDKRRLRIGINFDSLNGHSCDADVREGVEDAAALCKQLGHEVSAYKPKLDGQKTIDAFLLYWAGGAAQEAQMAEKANPGVKPETILEPWTLGLVEMAASAPKDAMRKAIATLLDAKKRYAAMFKDIDILMTPVLTSTAPMLGALSPAKPFKEVMPLIVDYVGYTPLENIAGAPAISAPLWWTKGGLPVGVHFAAAAGQEAMLLALAFELETARPWVNRIPPVHA